MIVSLESSSTELRKVGSSRMKRASALPRLSLILLSLGLIASEMTGLGTNMLDIATL